MSLSCLIDEIRPFKSVGCIVLGWQEHQVTRLLGSDYHRAINEFGELDVEYHRLRLRFTFWKDEAFRLGVIGTERPTASLGGTQLHGCSKSAIASFVSEALDAEVSGAGGCDHDDGSIQEWLDVDSHGLSFWFEDDSLYLIDVMCALLNENTPRWPDI